MLPERLSTDLTSLAQDQGRLSIAADMTISVAGAVAASETTARWRSIAPFAYNSVAARLNGTAASLRR
jgi:exoribonuclease R